MKSIKLRKKLPPAVSGDLLVADFHSALINLVTMDVAENEAKQSEANVVGALKYANESSDRIITSPNDISPAAAEYVMKNSVDAHLKKVQASQISSFTLEEVGRLEREDINKYKGRKVRVTRLNEDKNTFISLWADSRTGKFRRGNVSSRSIGGTIDDISFDKNILVLAPTFVSRTLQPSRKYFIVAVISMQFLQPNVKIELL